MDFNAVYVLGMLDGDELKQFEAHLKSDCPVCRAEISSFTEAASILPLALPQLVLSPDLKERVLFNAGLAQVTKAYVESAPQSATAGPSWPAEEPRDQLPGRSKPWLAYGLTFAAIVMLAGFSMYVNSLLKTIDGQNEYIGRQETQITKLVDEVNRKEAILKVLESRRIQLVTMDGLGVNPVGYGSIIWDPERKVAILHVSNLPTVPKDKDYQLWVIKDQRPASAGIFAVTDEKEKESFFQVRPLEVADRKDIDAFAVTLEPKGGVPQPTGEMYLLGKTSAP